MPAPTKAAMPELLLVQENYTIRVTALDASGNVVTAVKLSTVVLTADDVGGSGVVGGGGTGDLGEWFYVTGQEF